MRDALEKSPVRKKVVEYMGEKAMTNTDLAEAFRIDRRAMKRHMDTLERAGLVEREIKKGKKHR